MTRRLVTALTPDRFWNVLWWRRSRTRQVSVNMRCSVDRNIILHSESATTALGQTVPEIDLKGLGPLHLGTFAKTRFSMLTPQVIDIARLDARPARETSIVLFGIEVRWLPSGAVDPSHLPSVQSHVCVLQTALELLDRKFAVHVLADGVSSCNKEEVSIALEYIRRAGGHVSTSESVAFLLMRACPTSVSALPRRLSIRQRRRIRSPFQVVRGCHQRGKGVDQDRVGTPHAV